MKPVFKIVLGIGIICMLAALSLYLLNRSTDAEPFLIASLISVAIGIRGASALKGFAYPVMIFGVVSTAMIFPHYFLEINGYKLSGLITPLIQLIMFGMGITMSYRDFIGVFKSPKGVLVGVSSHFMIMPLLGFGLANISGFTPEIAAGMILIGCAPNAVAANVISYLAKANLALSITLTSIATLLAPFLTPLLMKLLGGSFIEINVFDMMWDIMKMVILPVTLAMVTNELLKDKMKWINAVMPIVSMFGIAFIIIIVTAVGRESLLTVGPLLILLVLVHNLMGYTIGYWFARLFKMSEKDSRTIAINVGMQNAGLSKGLAYGMGKLGTVGLAPMIFGPMMNITGSILASYWKGKPIADSDDKDVINKL
ncbi:bile acid:sodium symporter family protein [Daejeonella sp.]|jgi:BASS family bile acid:Na+ symporter|uniref:bile acid:sodium symporter family protein n=1 Tax=Daejeonella sp. TaxID=2805397 RepID=UPI0037C17DFB